MIFVYKDRIIQIEWSIFRGTSQVPEDFSRALVKLFLVGNYEKYAVPVTADGGTLVAQMPQDLPDGAYSLEAIWVKNYNNLFPVRGTDTPSVGSRNIRYPGPCHNDYGMTHPWDHRSNDRCLMRSRKEYVFAVTSYPGEETAVNQDGYVTIKISSAVATYGYDGLSAYEIAVMRGDFNGTEGEYLEQLKYELKVATDKKLGGITASEKTDRDTVEVKIDPETGKLYVPPSEAGEIEVATETTLGGIKAAEKTEQENVEVKIDSKTGKLYTKSGNNPDDEDLHLIERGDKQVLQLADKEYNSDSFSGLGRVYLRKNISNGKNVLTQAMMNKSNTRYIMQYDYDLDGGTITVPEGCTLDFQGGSLANGTITGVSTAILSNAGNIFHNIIIDGTFACANIYLSWFELNESDCLSQLLNCVKLSNGNVFSIVYLDKEISIKLTTSIPYIPVYSNTKIEGGIIHIITDNISSLYSVFQTRKGNENIIFDNISIYGDALTNSNDSDVNSQFGHGIYINGGKRITVTNCYITECFGDGINLQTGSAGVEEEVPENIKINNCSCNYNRRLGIAVEGGKDVIISNTTCKDNGKINALVYPGSGIDIEPWHEDNYVKNLVISGCDLRDNRAWSLAEYSWTEKCTDVIISDTVLNDIVVKNQNSHTTTFNGCNILGNTNVYDSVVNFNNCYMESRLYLQEAYINPHAINCNVNNCELYFNNEDYSYENYAPISFKNYNQGPLQTTNNKLVIKNSVIKIGDNIDVTKCYRLFSKSIGEGGDAVIELYNTEIVNDKNINLTSYVDYLENCKLKSSWDFVITLLENKPAIFKKCSFINSNPEKDAIIILGGVSNYSHKIDPYDVQFLQCSFNPDKIYSEPKSIDIYFNLSYVSKGDTNFSVLVRDPIFPIGTLYNAYDINMNRYYKINWLIQDRDFSKINIDNTLKSKVRYSLSNDLKNYVYRINKDIDLEGKNMSIGSGCVLDFSAGGRITNGTIALNNTLLLPLGLKVEDYISATIDGSYKEGQILYDSSLKKMKLWNGTAWVNMDGTALE